MTSRPTVSYNPDGEVTMMVENGVTVYMRFSPDVARVIGTQFMNMADGADKIRAKKAQAQKERMDIRQFGADAHSEKDGIGGAG